MTLFILILTSYIPYNNSLTSDIPYNNSLTSVNSSLKRFELVIPHSLITVVNFFYAKDPDVNWRANSIGTN